MAKRCGKKNCSAPRSLCAIGELNYRECPVWRSSQQDDSAQSALDDDREGFRLPWSGEVLGRDDINVISGVRRPLVIGVIGLHNAGKTTLLAAIYLLLCRGAHIGSLAFAGSYTLSAWERIANQLRWSDISPPEFPEHTELGAGRQPGLLHIALGGTASWNRDVLFTDAPGEWFSSWSLRVNDELAAGARWIAEHADAFILIADRGGLAGSMPAAARDNLMMLAQRLRDSRGSRPITIVATKADLAIPDDVDELTAADLARDLPGAPQMRVSVMAEFEPESCFVPLLEWLAAVVRQRRSVAPPRHVEISGDPLVNFRGHVR